MKRVPAKEVYDFWFDEKIRRIGLNKMKSLTEKFVVGFMRPGKQPVKDYYMSGD